MHERTVALALGKHNSVSEHMSKMIKDDTISDDEFVLCEI